MISIEEAQALAVSIRSSGPSEMIPLHSATGRILFQDVLSPSDHPAFDHSAVDGYAFVFAGKKEKRWIAGEIKAGDSAEINLTDAQCVRIFTGAKIPQGADTVVMQEHVSLENNWMIENDQHLKKGGNIRKFGEQIRKGETAMKAGEKLTPGGIGHLASLGVKEVQVSVLPRVGITVTGSEFADQPSDLEQGKIFESNGQMLAAALSHLCIHTKVSRIEDDLEVLTEHLRVQTEGNDILLITGGVSVGDYDFTKRALQALGFETIFHGVNQQPGKPLLLMKCGDKIAWGLPGNPRSVLVCFYTYVWPCLLHWMRAAQPQLPQVYLPLTQPYIKKMGRAQLLTAVLTPDGVLLDGQQNSNMLGSFAVAQALVQLPENPGEFAAGTMLKAFLLPV